MDAVKRNVLNELCRLVQEHNISFKSLDNDKSKAGLIVEVVNTVLWLADKAESDFVWRGGTHYIYVKNPLGADYF